MGWFLELFPLFVVLLPIVINSLKSVYEFYTISGWKGRRWLGIEWFGSKIKRSFQPSQEWLDFSANRHGRNDAGKVFVFRLHDTQ